jgi:Tfp pilus assembly protein PilF
MPYPDNDPTLEALRGMIRSKKPRYDMAEQRIVEVLGMDPANTEIHLMKTELMIALRASNDDLSRVFHETQQRAPTPEAFHAETTWWQMRNSGRGKAASALERGLEVFPESGRMRRRLAGIYVDQGRVDDAITQLTEAMSLEPMMPDTYGILGELYIGKGLFEKAEQCLEEARRLDPENGLHMARTGALLMELGVSERQAEAEALLKAAVEKDKRSYLAHLYYARIVLARPDGDLDHADWLLKQAQRLDERSALPLVERARIAIKRQNWVEATILLDKASRLDAGCHEAYFVRGEMYEVQGHIFNADQEFHRALERSPKDSKARVLYEVAIGRVQDLIASGEALVLQKAAEEAGIPAPMDPQPRSGSRTVRRKKGGKGPDEKESQAATGEETASGEEAVSQEESASNEENASDEEAVSNEEVQEEISEAGAVEESV